jgi:hypothetical protein
MIAVKLEGRLGNQLFQYAFIYAAAKKLGTSFYIDKSIENFIPPKYFEIKNDLFLPLDRSIFSVKGFKNIFSVHAKVGFYKWLHMLLLKQEAIIFSNHQTTKNELGKVKDGYLYEGYFQSETYFENAIADIRRLFKIKKQYTNAFQQVSATQSKSLKKIVIHIRRSDYVDLDIALPLAYYKKALDIVTDKDADYIFVSDDPEFIEKEFSHIKNKYVSNNNEIIDLQFLINADICILSNSSFSWWGAWLNSKPGKVIYGPKNWSGFGKDTEYPVGISANLPVNWISL